MTHAYKYSLSPTVIFPRTNSASHRASFSYHYHVRSPLLPVCKDKQRFMPVPLFVHAHTRYHVTFNFTGSISNIYVTIISPYGCVLMSHYHGSYCKYSQHSIFEVDGIGIHILLVDTSYFFGKCPGLVEKYPLHVIDSTAYHQFLMMTCKGSFLLS